MRRWLCLCAAVFALPALADSTDAEWRQWTARMDKAQRSLNYDATVVVDQGQDWELIELSQRIGPAGPEQQATTLNGERRRFVRTAQGVSLLGPEGNRSLAKAPDLISGVAPDQLVTAYQMHVEGRGRIAGRPVIQLSLTPSVDDRYGLRLWLDTDTGLPLRSDRLAADGTVVERRMITRLSVLGFAGLVPAPMPAGPAAAVSWQLPVGFRIVGDSLAVPGIEGGRQWVLSDGVAWVSIYRLPVLAGQKAAPHGWRRGATGQISLSTSEYWLYVLGDLPTATLERLGEAALASERVSP